MSDIKESVGLVEINDWSPKGNGSKESIEIVQIIKKTNHISPQTAQSDPIVTVDDFLVQKDYKDQSVNLESQDDLLNGVGEFVCMGKSKQKMEFSSKIKFTKKFINGK